MNERLTGNVVLFAGGTGRVGGATLERLLSDGARVAVVSRSADRAASLIRGSGSDSQRCLALEADLSRKDAGESIVRATVAWGGRIDAVVSLAGGGSAFRTIVDSSFADLEESFRNNLAVAYNLFVPALRQMLVQPFLDGARSRGRLVAVTAGSSLTPQPRFGIMGAGKAGVNVLMRSIAREHKIDGIVANAVILGTVAIDAAHEYLDAEEFAAAAQPKEVASVLAFHACDDSSGINGELVHLNAREVD